MTTETKLEEQLVVAIKSTNLYLPLLPKEDRVKAETEVIKLTMQLQKLLSGESTATTKAQEVALSKLAEISKEANEAKEDIVKLVKVISKLADAVEKVEHVAGKVVKFAGSIT